MLAGEIRKSWSHFTLGKHVTEKRIKKLIQTELNMKIEWPNGGLFTYSACFNTLHSQSGEGKVLSTHLDNKFLPEEFSLLFSIEIAS